ncbi:MAG: DUF3800 domain-containing protein [bacterium]
MRQEFNIYCDESCHLEHDHQKSMVLGALWCPKAKSQEAFERIREIKEKYRLPRTFEIKWNKVSPAQVAFYSELIDFFFDDDHLHFRALVVPDKSILDHSSHGQSHDEFYYKMYFDLLKVIFDPRDGYNIYLDMKDTRSQDKIKKLHKILEVSNYDFSRQIIRKIQHVLSHEVELLQIVDLLSGAVSYVHRGLQTSEAKAQLIEKIRHRSRYSLLNTTLYRESKMNIFVWKPRASK